MKSTKLILTMIMSFMLSGMNIYDITFEDARSDKKIDLADYKGKVIMIVNTASLCGFTKQFAELESLWKNYKDNDFVLIAVPTDSFGHQEPKNNDEIVSFCEVNFGIDFLIAKKVNAKGKDKHPFFNLVRKDFGLFATPKWNFFKYLYSANGKPLNWFSSLRTPNSKVIKSSIENNLPIPKEDRYENKD